MPVTIKKRVSGSRKGPEAEIVSVFHKAAQFYSSYKKQITAAAAVVLASALIIAVYSLIQSVRDAKASALLAAAYEYYNPSGGSPADYRKALDLYRDIQKSYPGTMSGAIAQYYTGNCLTNLGQTQEALKEYQNFVKKYSGERFLLGLTYQRMGYLYSALGNEAEALKSFEKAESAEGPGLATVELAKLYERSGNVVEAQKKYKEIAEKLAGTLWAMEAMSKVTSTVSLLPPAPKKEGK